jgi:hypothetical protein
VAGKSEMKNVFVVVALISIGTATTISAEYCVNFSSNLQSFMRQHGDYRTNACFSSQSQCESWANSMRSDSTHRYDLSGSCYSTGQNSSYSGGYSGNNALAGIIGIFMQGLMQGLENQQREAEKRAKEEQWKKEEEERRKKEKEQQQAAFINSQTNALNLLGNRPGRGTSFFGSPPTNTMGSNLEPIGSGKYDASPMKQIERLMCSTYFAQQALIAVKNHQDEKARYLNHQGDLVMEGRKYQEECKIPPIPQPPEPSLARVPDDTEAIKNIETITFSIQKDIKELQTLETKIQENKKKMDEAQLEKEKLETKIKEIQTKPIETMTSSEKEQQDTLIREAMALEEEINMMNKSYEKDVDEKSKIEGSLQEKSRKLQESQSKTLPSEKKDEKK